MKLAIAALLATTAVGFAPPAGQGTSGVRGEAALGAKRDFLRRIFRRPSRLAAKVRQRFFRLGFASLFGLFLCIIMCRKSIDCARSDL